MKARAVFFRIVAAAALPIIGLHAGCAAVLGIEDPAPDHCGDGVKNSGESGVDCGGVCGGCPGEKCTTESDCASGSCKSQRCADATCSDGIFNGLESDVDCGIAVTAEDPGCPCENGRFCRDDTNCRSHFCDQQDKVCTAGDTKVTCVNGTQDHGESDTDCGGPCEVKCANGKACSVDGDCASGTCVEQACVTITASCSDGIKNGHETDEDCGGSDPGCPKCGAGLQCMGGADCKGGSCSGGKCSATCNDLEKNQTETDVDCGGADGCDPCDEGKDCKVDADCVTDKCLGDLTCATLCNNMKPDGSNGETDVDCGGPQCDPCGPGKACSVSADCTSLMCQAALCL